MTSLTESAKLRRGPSRIAPWSALARWVPLLVRKARRTPDQWADAERVLPKGSAEPGAFRSSRTPYMIPIVRACVDHRIREVVVVMGAQMGKTENMLNVIGHRLDDDPVPTLYIGPTQKLVESISRDRFAKMFASSRSLAERMSQTRGTRTARESANSSWSYEWSRRLRKP